MIQTISLLLLCSDVVDYFRKVSPLEASKDRDSLLKKLVCVCMCVGGLRVDMCRMSLALMNNRPKSLSTG